jgi:hypothetical protein
MRFEIPGHLPGLVPEPLSTEKKSSDADRDRSRSSVPDPRFPVPGSRFPGSRVPGRGPRGNLPWLSPWRSGRRAMSFGAWPALMPDFPYRPPTSYPKSTDHQSPS